MPEDSVGVRIREVALGTVGGTPFRPTYELVFVFMARKMSPTEKGCVAELAIAARAAQLGVGVAWPMMEGRRYDLIFDVDHTLLRVQCKWAALEGDTIRINTRTCRHTPLHGYVRSTYSAAEIDMIAAYSADLDTVYALPIAEFAGQSMVSLRLSPTKNNQRSLVRWARDYELGAIAQLGERLHGMQEVAGSSPASSTPPKAAEQAAFVVPVPR